MYFEHVLCGWPLSLHHHLILTSVFNFTKRENRIGFKLWFLWLQSITAQLPDLPHTFCLRRWRTKLEHPLLSAPTCFYPCMLWHHFQATSQISFSLANSGLFASPPQPKPRRVRRNRVCHPRRGAVNIDNYELGVVDREESSQVSLGQSPLLIVSLLKMAQQTFICQTFAFLSLCKLFSCLFKSQIATCLFFLAQDGM